MPNPDAQEGPGYLNDYSAQSFFEKCNQDGHLDPKLGCKKTITKKDLRSQFADFKIIEDGIIEEPESRNKNQIHSFRYIFFKKQIESLH